VKQAPETRPAEEPGTPPREMVTLDRIRLTGLLRKSPVLQGFSICRTGPVHHRCITRLPISFAIREVA
jgi:hypothetical protein